MDDVTMGRLVNETTTIMPDDAQPTVTKTYMYMKTKDFVLSCAAKDASLRGLLFYYPHSLDHIVECLHYKFLWDNYYMKDDVETATGGDSSKYDDEEEAGGEEDVQEQNEESMNDTDDAANSNKDGRKEEAN